MDPFDDQLNEALRQWRERMGPEYRQDMAQPEHEPYEPELGEFSGPNPFTSPSMGEPPPMGEPVLEAPDEFGDQFHGIGHPLLPMGDPPPYTPPPRPLPPDNTQLHRPPVFRPGGTGPGSSFENAGYARNRGF